MPPPASNRRSDDLREQDAPGNQCCTLHGSNAMHLDDDVGRVGPTPRSLAREVAISEDHRDYLTGRLLPGNGHLTGTLDALDEALERGTLTLQDLKVIIATAEGRFHRAVSACKYIA